MKTYLKASLVAALLIAPTLTLAASDKAVGQLDKSWGDLTKEAVAGGFEQGPHSSDPSGDGHGPGTADESRAGLGNVVERGNMAATTEFIGDALP
jgi:hypothetical protein